MATAFAHLLNLESAENKIHISDEGLSSNTSQSKREILDLFILMVNVRPEIFYPEFFSHHLKNLLIRFCTSGLSKIFQFAVLKHTVQNCNFWANQNPFTRN